MYKDREQATSPLGAIKEHCKECMDDLYKEIKECPGEGKCQLWPFRFGKNPFRKKRKYTKEQREELVDRMKKAREAKDE